MAGVASMGRPKKSASKPERPADDRVAVIHLKGSAAYSDWLDQVHRKSHIPKASLFRVALAEWAERNGYPPPPEL